MVFSLLYINGDFFIIYRLWYLYHRWCFLYNVDVISFYHSRWWFLYHILMVISLLYIYCNMIEKTHNTIRKSHTLKKTRPMIKKSRSMIKEARSMIKKSRSMIKEARSMMTGWLGIRIMCPSGATCVQELLFQWASTIKNQPSVFV
jgi:hypothetical protein